jgi:hypothetical protein
VWLYGVLSVCHVLCNYIKFWRRGKDHIQKSYIKSKPSVLREIKDFWEPSTESERGNNR